MTSEKSASDKVADEIYRIMFVMTVNKLIWRVPGNTRLDELPGYGD